MKRENIINDLVTWLKTITPDNGYNSDFANCVYSWKTEQIPENVSLWVEIHDPAVDITNKYNIPNVEMALAINIVVFCSDGSQTAGNIRKAIEDIYRLIIAKRVALITSYQCKFELEGDEMEIFEEDIIAGVGFIKLKFEYIETFTPAVPL